MKVQWIVLVALAAAVLTGCTPSSRVSEVRIGVISMLSGDQARPSARDMGRSARLAAKLSNAAGGLRVGRARLPAMILEEDDRNSPESAVEAARRLINSGRVVALVGPQFSSNAIPVARLAEQQHIVMICPMSTNPETTAGRSFVFRIPYLDTFQGKVLARFARETIGSTRAAVLYDVASEYNRTLADVFALTFTSLGGEVARVETYTSDDRSDFSAQLDRIAASAPDILFLPNYADDSLLQARQARSLGIRATLLGGDGWDGSAFASDPAFDGAYYTTPWHPDAGNEESRAFVAAFTLEYGEPPSDVAATAYDAVTMLFAAIEGAGQVEPEAIRDELHAMSSFAGVTGRISYPSGGDPVKSAIVVRIASGGARAFGVVEP